MKIFHPKHPLFATAVWIASAIVTFFVTAAIVFYLIATPQQRSKGTWKPGSCRFSMDISRENKARIEEIVSTVTNTGLLSLSGKRKHLTQLGDILHKEVPSLEFWGYIFSRPDLAHDMKLIQDSSLKYNEFVSGGRDQVLGEYHADPECYLSQARGFAKFLGLNPDKTVEILERSIKAAEKSPKGLRPMLDYLIAEQSR